MIFNVPQFIDVEDKIAGPFTAKQLLWMFAMGGVLLIIWTLFEKTVFYVMVVPVALVFLALAFYRPQGVPLIKFIFFGLAFLFQPKIYSWKRLPKVKKIEQPAKKESLANRKTEKKITPDYIKSLAKTIDSGGREADPQVIKASLEATKTKKQKNFPFFKKTTKSADQTPKSNVLTQFSTSPSSVTDQEKLTNYPSKKVETQDEIPTFANQPAENTQKNQTKMETNPKSEASDVSAPASEEGKIIFTKY